MHPQKSKTEGIFFKRSFRISTTIFLMVIGTYWVVMMLKLTMDILRSNFMNKVKRSKKLARVTRTHRQT